MGDDWDLYAVVRSCSTAATAATAAEKSTFTPPPSCSAYGFSPIKFQENEQFLNFPDLQETRGSDESIADLHDMFKAFCPKLQSQNKPFCPKIQPICPQNIPISPLSVLGDLPDLSPQKKQKVESETTFSAVTTTPRHCSRNPRSKRRKNQIKRVCQVPVGGLSSDMWYWRKYGQKPIKGSPYPRSYYKCSTSKGCLARKQVERNRSDPDMFIVTYSAEHNHPVPTHRDSLAGSTCQKISTTETVADGDPNKLICSTPVSPAASLSTAPEKFEVEEEDDELWASDTPLSDDFFVGLEDIKVPGAGDGVMDHFPMFSWTGNNATTTAAGGV